MGAGKDPVMVRGLIRAEPIAVRGEVFQVFRSVNTVIDCKPRHPSTSPLGEKAQGRQGAITFLFEMAGNQRQAQSWTINGGEIFLTGEVHQGRISGPLGGTVQSNTAIKR